MRVLFVTPYVPSRIRVRPFHAIQALATSHEVSLVALVCDAYERELAREIEPYCASFDLVSLPKRQAYANCIRALPTLTPLRVAYYQSPAFIERILEVIRARKINVVHGELIKTAPALRAVLEQTGVPVVYDSVDCISSYLEQQWQTVRNPLKRAFVYSEYKKMQRYEARMSASFSATVITSPHDKEVLSRLQQWYGDAKRVEQARKVGVISVVPNGVDTCYFTPPNVPRQRDSLVFCAKMDYYPNVQAMLSFRDEVLPRLWKHRPDVRLTIVGNNPPVAIQELASDARITVTGYVPDTRPYLGKASVALAPLRVAAGMQNKVLEAMAMGTPLVATPSSCRALDVQHERHLLLAQEYEAFAQAILRLLEDDVLALTLSRAGRTFVEQHHSWDATASLLTDVYGQVVVAIRDTTRTAMVDSPKAVMAR
jgi:sugar transferase (PEP-CTERM/EpsH1 system associated)